MNARHLVPFAAALSGAVIGCTPQPYPGSPVGTFHIVGEVTSNTCGAGVPVTNPIGIDVEIRGDGMGTAYWRTTGASASSLIAGVITPGEVFTFSQAAQTVVQQPNMSLNFVGCTVDQVETLSGSISYPVVADAGVDASDDAGSGDDGGVTATGMDGGVPTDAGPSSLSGTETISFSPTTGYDCSQAFVTLGGPFATLPCQITYTLVGYPRASF